MLSLIQVAKKSETTIIIYKIYENWRTKRRFRRGGLQLNHGSTHLNRPLSQSISYIEAQFNDYVKYSGMALEELNNKKIFELGFGDNVGVALKFIANGASFVACLDKFLAARDVEQERRIYLALRETLEDYSKARFDQAIDLTRGVEINSEKLVCFHGSDIENEAALKKVAPFDLLVSRAAIQEIYDPTAAFLTMDKLLREGGLMLHKIDLSDLGMFRDHGMNPLTFLTIPEPIFRLMARGSGSTNRRLISYYRDLMNHLRYETKFLVTDLVGRRGKGDLSPHKERLEFGIDYDQKTLALVAKIRHRLIPAFRNLSDEDLMITGVFLVARKPNQRF